MTFVLNEVGPEWNSAWDALVTATPESGFMQSSAWSQFKRTEGFSTPRYGLFENGVLCGGGAMLDYQLPGADGLIVCPEGPILPWHDQPKARDGLRLLAAAAEERAALSGGLGLRIEPRISLPGPGLLRNWTRAPVDLNPAHSLVVDVTGCDAEILARMHPKGRYNIRVGIRHGVQVTRSTAMSDVRSFHTLFTDTALRQGFFAEPYSFFLNLGAALFPCGMADLYFAHWNGEMLAAILVITFGSRATYLYGASSNLSRHVMPTYALHWHAICDAKRRGCTEYDLYGYDPFDQPDHPYAGFSRYKRQFGGRRFDALGAYDLVFYERLADRVVERMQIYR